MIGLASLLLAAVAAQSQQTVEADPATCNLETATRVDLRFLLDNRDRWYGRCVSVVGLWSGRAFYTEVRDAHPRGEAADDSRDRRLGIYASEALARLARPAPRSYRAAGVLLSCECLWEGQLFVSGYCHNNLEGPILAVTQIRPAR